LRFQISAEVLRSGLDSGHIALNERNCTDVVRPRGEICLAVNSSRHVPGPSGGDPADEIALLVRADDYWTLRYRGRTSLLKDIKGLGYLERLLRNPDQEFSSFDLEFGSAAPIEQLKPEVADTLTIGGPGDSGEMLDRQALNEYRQRLRDLRQEFEEQRERGDVERAARTESEIDFLARELRRALGLGGRVRPAGSAAERARLNVTRAIKASIERISEGQSALGQLLRRTIKTGLYCSYVPDTGHRLTWQFSLESPTQPLETIDTGPLLPSHQTTFIEADENRTIFVGRKKEHLLLRLCLGRVQRGKRKVVTLSGAAGVGKSRLANEIRAEASRNGFVTLGGNCQEQGASFTPFVQMLEAIFVQAPNSAAARELLAGDAPHIARLLPHLARGFIDIPQLPEASPEHSRLMLLSSVANVLGRFAAQNPLLLVIDDLHWADEGTSSLIAHLVRSLPERPLMIIGTYRDSEWNPKGPLAALLDDLVRNQMLEPIALGGLTEEDVGEMIQALSGHTPPAPIRSFINAGTEGNPFFVEELYRDLAESGKLLDSTGQFQEHLIPADLSVPWNLRVVIGGRLARRSEESLKVLRTAAVLGRSFNFALLEAATGTGEDALLDCVEEAEWAGLIVLVERYPDAQFKFSHELIRQAVLDRLSAPRRQRLHLQVANAIERIHAAELEDHADELAHQLWHAGKAAEAGRTVRYLSMAAKQAINRSVYPEAITHLKRGLDLLRIQPSRSANAQELALHLDLGRKLMSTKGYSDPEVLEAFAKAHKLCGQLGESPEVTPAKLGLWAFYLVRAEYVIAQELAQETLNQACRQGDAAAEMEAHLRLGVTLWYRGQPRAAREHLERCIELHHPERDRPHAILYGQDPAVAARSYLGLVLWQLGYPDQAIKVSHAGLEAARRLEHPLTLCFALCYSVWLHVELGAWMEFATLADELERLATARGFVLWAALSTMFQSILLAGQGQIEQALAAARRGISAYRATGAGAGVPMFLAFQAGLLSTFGDASDAMALLSEASELATASGELNSEAELTRLKGHLIMKLSKTASAPALGSSLSETMAEEFFMRALDLSRLNESKSHELRAAMSLARVWRRQGQIDRAHQTLADVYAWFTEGFETADLRRAKALLAELSGQPGS